jgi:uncharacterized membrane protein YphA (DoxX/SURF4 family)
MKKLLANEVLILFSRVLLGTVFVVASIEKIAVPELFASSIQAYRMLPEAPVNLFALWLPWIELLTGLFLLGGVAVRASALLVSSMLLVFVVALVSVVMRGLEIDCGCFGGISQTQVGWGKILEDLGLLLLAIHLIAFPPAKFTLQRPETDPAG